jgi:hypothetical protein
MSVCYAILLSTECSLRLQMLLVLCDVKVLSNCPNALSKAAIVSATSVISCLVSL